MTSSVSWSAPVMASSWFILVLLLSLQPTHAQICSFWESSCVDPLAQTAVPINYRPLFLQDISLYYAYDANPNGKGQEPMTKASFWLTLNNPIADMTAITANRTSEVGMRVGNLTGSPGGSNNGCDNIWGASCSKDIKDALRSNMYHLAVKGDYYSQPLETVLNQLAVTPPSLPNCPPQIFQVSDLPVIGMRFSPFMHLILTPPVFCQETVVPNRTAWVHSPGSVDNPFKAWYLDNMTANNQADQVGVAFFSRGPTYNSQPPDNEHDIQIELACVQAPSGGSGSNG